MSETTEEESRGTHQWAIDLALTDLLSAATDFFKLWPELRELRIEKQDDGVWAILPNGVKHGFGSSPFLDNQNATEKTNG